MSAEVALDANACKQKGRCRNFFEALLDSLRDRAETENVAITDMLPLMGSPRNYTSFDVRDEPAPAVWNPDSALEVVGVVGNSHDQGTLAGAFGDQVWLPLTRTREQPVMYVLMRTRTGLQDAATTLRGMVARIDPFVPVTHVRSLNEVLAASVSASRSVTILVLTFAVLALGATRRQILMTVMRQSLILAAAGSVVGLAASGLLSQLLRTFLFGVSSLDPLTFSAAPVLMLMLALLATWFPARKAAAVDPMRTLRQE